MNIFDLCQPQGISPSKMLPGESESDTRGFSAPAHPATSAAGSGAGDAPGRSAAPRRRSSRWRLKGSAARIVAARSSRRGIRADGLDVGHDPGGQTARCCQRNPASPTSPGSRLDGFPTYAVPCISLLLASYIKRTSSQCRFMSSTPAPFRTAIRVEPRATSTTMTPTFFCGRRSRRRRSSWGRLWPTRPMALDTLPASSMAALRRVPSGFSSGS